MKNYFFTSESVTEGHPDKVADLISDNVANYLINQMKVIELLSKQWFHLIW